MLNRGQAEHRSLKESKILETADDVWAAGDLILKVKEPIAAEYHRMRAAAVLVITSGVLYTARADRTPSVSAKVRGTVAGMCAAGHDDQAAGHEHLR